MKLKPSALLRTLSAAVLLGFFTPAVLARPLEIQDELRRSEPASFRFSPDGRWVAVAVRRLEGFETQWNDAARYDGEDGIRRASGQQLLIIEVATQRVLYRSDPTVSAMDAQWARDSSFVAFFVRGAKTTQIWRWNRSSGRVDKSRGQVDDRLFAGRGPSFELAADPASVLVRIERNERVIPKPTRSWEPRVFTANTEGPQQQPPNLENARFDLYLWNLNTGARRMIEEDTGVYYTAVSPDGSSVAYWRYSGTGMAPRRVYFFDLFVYDFGRGHAKRLAARVQLAPREAAVFWSPDSRKLAYFSHATTGAETMTSRSLWTVDLGGAEPRLLVDGERDGRLTGGTVSWNKTGDRLYAASKDGWLQVDTVDASPVRLFPVPADYTLNSALSIDGNAMWFRATRNSDAIPVVLRVDPMSGTRESLWVLPKEAGTPVVSPGGETVLFSQQAADVPPGLWALRTGTQTPQPFAGLVPDMKDIGLGRSKLIEFVSSDGVKLKAALLLPHGYKEGTRVPTVVWVYPGNQSRAVNIYALGGRGPMNAQLLASRGYAVLKPDSKMYEGYPVESLARSILPAITAVIGMGIADPDRIGLWGHSQGGMSTVALLTRSTLFKAAVASNGYYNLVSFYGALNDWGRDGAAQILEEYNNILTTPWRDQRVYLENSPVLNLDRVKTPLLMVVGLADVSVPKSQAEEVFVGLKRLGTKVALVEYPNATHVPYDWESAQQVDYAQRMVGWFDAHLKGVSH